MILLRSVLVVIRSTPHGGYDGVCSGEMGGLGWSDVFALGQVTAKGSMRKRGSSVAHSQPKKQVSSNKFVRKILRRTGGRDAQFADHAMLITYTQVSQRLGMKISLETGEKNEETGYKYQGRVQGEFASPPS